MSTVRSFILRARENSASNATPYCRIRNDMDSVRRVDLAWSNGRLSTEDDLRRAIQELATYEEEVLFDAVIEEPMLAIEMGLWPNLIPIDWLPDWYSGVPTTDIKFWHSVDAEEEIYEMGDKWRYRPLEVQKKRAVEQGSSIPLYLYAPELIYSGSRRPKTEMNLFRTPLSRTIKRRAVIDNQVFLDGELWNVIPVARYAAGMSRGLYFSESKEKVCGTFYYMEPESTTFLAYKTALTSFNKTTACLSLGVDLDANRDLVMESMTHVEGKYPRDLMMTPREAHSASTTNRPLEDVSDIKHYAGVWLGMYALEDPLDQLLCIGARDAEYDIVILESMVGKFQIVTEVLDTRSREDSFSSLIYAIN